jgi:hypothetical protein
VKIRSLGRACRRKSFLSVVQGNCQILFAVQDKKWLLQVGQDIGQRPLHDAFESLFHRFGTHHPRKLKKWDGDALASSSPASLPPRTRIPESRPKRLKP